MSDKKRILVAPLDWGLGHAARCIPIINEIVLLGHEVVVATDGRAYDLLKSEFPELQTVRLNGYKPRYPKNGNMVLSMGIQVPKFLIAIVREHYQLRELIRDYSIDAVISDNRYGLWSKRVKSVLITHQIFIKMPTGLSWFQSGINRLNHFFIRQFHQCWVPDEEGELNLSGALSHGTLPDNVRYIGLLSRFQFARSERGSSKRNYDLLALLSGPEPQRTILEQEIIKQSTSLKLKTLVVRGVPEESRFDRLNEFVDQVSHLQSRQLADAIAQTRTVVCRAGYSSLMDLVTLQKKALIIPTPGQTEQEYLADRCSELNYFSTQKQSEFNIESAFTQIEQTAPPWVSHKNRIKEQIASLLAQV